jgi:hypothetical protein
MSGSYIVQDQTRSRYPGTRPFSDSPEDVAKFFGRSTETEDLYLRVLSVPLLVQFGKSGLGKTSLLQAGLFPLLRKRAFLPVMVRLNVESEPLLAAVQRAIIESCALENLKYKPVPVTGLWDLLDDLTIWRRDLLLTPVLVFDQFEEVFTLRDAAFRRELAEELGALATGIPPRGMAPTGSTPDLKLIISLREDYLGSLEEFSAAIPGLFHERLRLEPLSDQSARTAITAPALLEGDYDSPPFEFDEATLDAMIAYLKGRSGVIEPFQLQLLCRSAEKIATRKAGTKKEKVTLTLGDFQQGRAFASVLDRFYTDTLNKLSKQQRRRAARLCEEGLLGAGGHRLMLEQRQILDDYRVAPEALKTLADERLIRREARQESVFYEISHDRLAESIRNAREAKMPRKAKRLLWVAALTLVALFAGLTLWNGFLSRERDRAKASLARAEGLISFLLGEQFLGEIRDGGRSSLLKLVQSRIDEEEQTPFNRGLALRNSGDIERATGRIGTAVDLFRKALTSFDVKSKDIAVVREAARTHHRLGEGLTNAGQTRDAVTHLDAAIEAFRRVATSAGPVTTDDCTSLADSLIVAAEARGQLGQTDRATADLERAAGIVSAILFGHHKGPEKCAPADRIEPYPDAKAVQMLADIASVRATVVGDFEDFEGAAVLASAASSLNPPSISARQAAFRTRAMRGNARREAQPELAIEDYRQALADADVLRRWDPSNRAWQRERAANQLLLSQMVTTCHADPAATCAAMPSLTSAQAISLEALATMRALSTFDPDNTSLRDDVAWAFDTYANTLAPADRLPVIDEALREYGGERPERVTEPHRVFNRADLLSAKATALELVNRHAEARATIRESAEVLGRLAAAHPDNPRYLEAVGEARFREAEIGYKAGDTRGAQAAEAEVERLSGRMDKLVNPLEQRLAELDVIDRRQRDAGIALALQRNHAGAVRELLLSEAAVREYARVNPSDYGAYRDLSLTYEALGESYKHLGNAAAQGAALRAGMHAAQIAAWLASGDDQQSLNRNLLLTRLSLAIYLVGQKDFPAAATIVQETAAVAESLANGPDANPFYLFALGKATCNLGDIRLLWGRAGWEEAYRSGIIHLRRAATANDTYADALAGCEQSLLTAQSRSQQQRTRAVR